MSLHIRVNNWEYLVAEWASNLFHEQFNSVRSLFLFFSVSCQR